MGESGAAGPGIGRPDVDDGPGRPGFDMTTGEPREQKNVPLRVMSTTVRQALGDISSAGTGKFAATLLMSTSGRPNVPRGLVEGGTDLIGVTDVAGHSEHSGPECFDRLPTRIKVVSFGWR